VSRIYLHSPSGEARVYGTQRHAFGNLCNSLACAVVGSSMCGEPHWLVQFLPKDCYLLRGNASAAFRGPVFDTDLHGYLRYSQNDFLTTSDGEKIAIGIAIANTVMRLGSDVVKLACRLHNQCEIHCWAEGPNRAWLADLCERALSDNVFQPLVGWPEAIAFLRARDDEPVVFSYSVCMQFPNPWFLLENGSATVDGVEGVDDNREEALREEWAEKQWADKASLWQRCMATLRQRWPLLELKPDNWDHYWFGRNISFLDLHSTWLEARWRKEAIGSSFST